MKHFHFFLALLLGVSFVVKAQTVIDNFDTSALDSVYDLISEGASINVADNNIDFVEGTGSMDFEAMIPSLHDWGSFANLNYRVGYEDRMDWSDSDTLSIWIKVHNAPANPENVVFRVHVADMPAATSQVEEFIYENAVAIDAATDWYELKIPFIERPTDGNTLPNDEGFVISPYFWGGARNNSALDKNAIVGYNIVGVTTTIAADSFKISLDKFTRNTGAAVQEPIVLDGIVDDANYQTLASWGGADNWSSNNDLGELKFYGDGQKVYIGLSGHIEENWNKMVIFADFDGYDGIPAGTALPTGGNNAFFQDGGIAGTKLNMETDYAFSFTADQNNPLYCDAAHYDATTMVAGDGLGYSGKDGSFARFNPLQVIAVLGGTTGMAKQAYLNDFDRTTNPDHGLELALDLTAFEGGDSSQSVRFFVAIVNADGNYWSNEFLPDYYDSTGGSSGPFGGDFQNDPDLNTAALNANVELYTGLSPVPVELTSFAASAQNNTVRLSWKTQSELNNKEFMVERSFGSENWETIGSVKGAGTTTETNSYGFVDRDITVSGTYYYRLKQVDFSGKYEYSDVIEVSVKLPSEFRLSQNYPNPFNPDTRIAYSIPSSGNIKLAVYNILGQKVADLVNGFVEAGKHSVIFKAGNLTSGIYFYKIEADNFVSVKKMMLIK